MSYRTTDYCAVCGCSPDAAEHFAGKFSHDYVPPDGTYPTYWARNWGRVWKAIDSLAHNLTVAAALCRAYELASSI